MSRTPDTVRTLPARAAADAAASAATATIANTASPALRATALLPLAAALALLAGCAGVGPHFQPPAATAPARWEQRGSSAPDLSGSVPVSDAALPADWWTVFGDSTLDTLQQQLRDGNPDLRTAALRFAQSRLQRTMTASQLGPQFNVNGEVTRQRQSESSPETRLVNAIAGNNSKALIDLLASPFTLYQAGFDASWEIDLWGRVRRSVESADANADAAGALLESTALSLSSELARDYFQLRQAQRQQTLLALDIAVTTDGLQLLEAQARHGLIDHDKVLTQRTHVADLTAQLAALRARQAALANQIGVLTGKLPGELNTLLAATPAEGLAPSPADTIAAAPTAAPAMPDLAMGLPSDLARRRPDIRSAEAQLHAATADVGVAVADLYPRLTIGASAGLQTISAATFTDWGSRVWQIGPSLTLPIFDNGRRRATVELRKVEQQQAAVAYQQTVLKAWQEIDDALTGYAAERQRNAQLRARLDDQRQAWQLARARYVNGVGNDLAPLQAEVTWLQTAGDLTESDARLRTGLVAVYKAAGGGVADTPAAGGVADTPTGGERLVQARKQGGPL